MSSGTMNVRAASSASSRDIAGIGAHERDLLADHADAPIGRTMVTEKIGVPFSARVGEEVDELVTALALVLDVIRLVRPRAADRP